MDICCKNCIVVRLKKNENKQKEAVMCHLKKQISLSAYECECAVNVPLSLVFYKTSKVSRKVKSDENNNKNNKRPPDNYATHA